MIEREKYQPPADAIEALARCLLPTIRSYFESEEVLCCKGSLKKLYYITHSSRPSVAIRVRLKAA